MSKSVFVRRRSAALLSVAAMATTGLIAAGGPAGAAITAGPDDDVTGFPAYMVDDQGMAVQMCLDACLEVPEEGEEPAPGEEPAAADPNHAPYFSAEAVAGPFTVAYEVATDAEVEGQPGELVNAAGIRAEGVTPGATYRINGPWGALRATADDRGRVAVERLNAVKGFLRPLALSGDVLGDGHIATRVTGSPTGFNRVTVTGPGVKAGTNQFFLMGQLAEDTAMTAVNVKSLNLSAGKVTKQIRYTNYGTAAATPQVSITGPNAARFRVQQIGSVAEGGSALINVRYLPVANRTASANLVIRDNSLVPAKRVALTGKGPDTLAPKLASRTPAKGASAVRPAASVKVKFSEAVRGLNRSTFTLVDNQGQKVRAALSKRRGAFVLNPRQALDRDEKYTVKLNGGARQIHDLAGNAARDAQWSFRTR